ncbi:MAG TPA: biopolymer transporter ExbD [Opitutaceae bacterium]
MSKKPLSQSDEMTDINISPLIDMVFILLIFFIVTTVFVEEQGVTVDKPEPSGKPMTETKTLIITISGTGQILHEGREVGVPGVGALVRQFAAKNRSTAPETVILEIADKSQSGLIVRVIDEVQIAGGRASLTPKS